MEIVLIEMVVFYVINFIVVLNILLLVCMLFFIKLPKYLLMDLIFCI